MTLLANIDLFQMLFTTITNINIPPFFEDVLVAYLMNSVVVELTGPCHILMPGTQNWIRQMTWFICIEADTCESGLRAFKY